MDDTNFPKGIEVVCSAIIENNDGKILIVKQPKWHNKWTFPGGHIEPGEKIENAIRREVKEEIGLDKIKYLGIISSGELINSLDFKRPAHFIYFDAWCKTDDINVKLDNKEISEYVWIEPIEALKYELAESYAKVIKDFINYKNLKLNH